MDVFVEHNRQQHCKLAPAPIADFAVRSTTIVRPRANAQHTRIMRSILFHASAVIIAVGANHTRGGGAIQGVLAANWEIACTAERSVCLYFSIAGTLEHEMLPGVTPHGDAPADAGVKQNT